MSTWLRLLRSVLIIALGLVLSILAFVFIVCCVPPSFAAFAPLMRFGSAPLDLPQVLTMLAAAILPMSLLAVSAWRRWLNWRVLAVSWTGVIAVFSWLAWDDDIRQPLPIEEFAPAFPGAEESYAVLMQYSRLTSSEEAKAFGAFKSAAPNARWSDLANPEKRTDFITQNRAAIETDWAALAPQRRWFAELAAFDRIGDLTPASYEANIMGFQVWRTLSQHTCAMASLLAIDGRGDEAIALLVPQLAVSRKLQLSSRTLVRTMIALVCEKQALETVSFVLERTPVSAASRTQLAAALGPDNATELAGRLALIEYAISSSVYGKLPFGDIAAAISGHQKMFLRQPLNACSRCFFNPIRTMNLYGQYSRELSGLAATRKLDEFDARSSEVKILMGRHPSMKNPGGRMLLSMVIPNQGRTIQSHWKTADLRAALRARLALAD